MIQQNELIMLLLGAGVLVFLIANIDQLRRVGEYRLLMASYIVLFCAWVFTVLEGLFLGRFNNFMEHLCYAASSIVLCVWIWKTCRSGKDASDAVDRPV